MVARGLMASDAHLGGKVEHFYRDHGAEVGGASGGWKLSLALVAFVAIFTLWSIFS
jgi:hypothetical protein